MITRRGFMASLLAAASAPAIVRAGSLMRWRPTEGGILNRQGIVGQVGTAQWVDDGLLWSSDITGPIWTAPKGVSSVFISIVGSGGGGSGPARSRTGGLPTQVTFYAVDVPPDRIIRIGNDEV